MASITPSIKPLSGSEGWNAPLRKQKRKILIDDKTGDKNKLAIDQTRYVIADAEYKRFSKAAGLRLQHERANVRGLGRSSIVRQRLPCNPQKRMFL